MFLFTIFLRRFFSFFLVIFFFNFLYFFVLDPSIVIYNLVLIFFLLLSFLTTFQDLDPVIYGKFDYSSVFYFLYHRSLSFRRILFFSFVYYLYDYISASFLHTFSSFRMFLVSSLYLYMYKYINFLIKKKHSISLIVFKSCYSRTINLFFRSFFSVTF